MLRLIELEPRDAPARLVVYDRPPGAVDSVGAGAVVPDDADLRRPVNFTYGSGPLVVVIDDPQDAYAPDEEERFGRAVWAGLEPFRDLLTLTNNPPDAARRVAPWARVTGIVVPEITWRPAGVAGESSAYLPYPDVDTEPRFYAERHTDRVTGIDYTPRIWLHEFGHVAGVGGDPEPWGYVHHPVSVDPAEPRYPDRDVTLIRAAALAFVRFFGLTD